MIGYLNGNVRVMGTTTVVVAGGVGYIVSTPQRLEAGDDVELFITSQTRDTGTRLFGFTSHAEQQLFTALCDVPSVGPAMALSVVALGVGSVVRAITDNDAATIARANGVGKKTAGSIVTLAKVAHIAVADDDTAPRTSDDVADALSALGFGTARIASVLTALREAGVDDDDTLLRQALADLR